MHLLMVVGNKRRTPDVLHIVHTAPTAAAAGSGVMQKDVRARAPSPKCDKGHYETAGVGLRIVRGPKGTRDAGHTWRRWRYGQWRRRRRWRRR